ncbi:MAG: hypothetical protein LBH29_06380 [Elusimicrobiota bacterium]|jgi:hypothetical protein|nr:hypothetical protein [Elusimicrobiota bacterium]
MKKYNIVLIAVVSFFLFFIQQAVAQAESAVESRELLKTEKRRRNTDQKIQTWEIKTAISSASRKTVPAPNRTYRVSDRSQLNLRLGISPLSVLSYETDVFVNYVKLDSLSIKDSFKGKGIGFELSADLTDYPAENFGWGGGLSYIAPRKINDIDVSFSALNMYGLVKVRTNNLGSDKIPVLLYIVSHLGFSIPFLSFQDVYIEGEKVNIKTSPFGLLLALGTGVEIQKFTIGLLYQVFFLSGSQDGSYNQYRLSTDDRYIYELITLNLGYKFEW